MTEHKLIAPHDKRRIYDRQNGLCAYCGQHRNIKHMTVDHIIPLSKGGTDSLDNLQCACKMCNRIKDNMLPLEFSEHIHRIFINNLKFCELELCQKRF